MKYNIRGDKMLITDAIKDYTETKLGRLEKYFSCRLPKESTNRAE